MADSKNSLNGTTQGTLNNVPAAPLVVNAQYLKDFSFENPGAPQALIGSQKGPEINISLDVEVRPLSGATYESVLKIKAQAQQAEKVIFIADLSYAGVFTVQGIPEEQHRPLLVVEGARILFPFARAILAQATQDGGFPPLMLGPIDFAEMFRRSQKDQMAQKNTSSTANA